MSTKAKPRSKRKLDVSSGWHTYFDATKTQILQNSPDLTKRELYSIVSKMWEEEPNDQRLIYSRMEKRHSRRKKESDESDSDSGFENEKRKHHISAHSVYVNEKQKELQLTNPELTLLERTKIISMQWKKLGYREKLIYENKAKCFNRRIDKDSTDSDEEKYVITKRPKHEEVSFDSFAEETSSNEANDQPY